MKKFLVIILAVVCAAAVVPQQLSADVGVKAGFNFANITVKPAATGMPALQNLTGLTGGLYFSLNIAFVGIEPEILYSRRGVQWNEDTTNIKNQLDYVEVPVLLKLNIMPAGPIRPVIFGGPSFGFLFKATEVETSPEGTIRSDIKSQFKKTEVAAVFGAGLEFRLPLIKLSIDGRYHLGASNISAVTDGTETKKNKGFSVLVGIGF